MQEASFLWLDVVVSWLPAGLLGISETVLLVVTDRTNKSAITGQALLLALIVSHYHSLTGPTTAPLLTGNISGSALTYMPF